MPRTDIGARSRIRQRLEGGGWRVSVPVRNFLKNRRDRALGTILGYAERELWPRLSQADREALRSVVIDALNGYHDAVLDLVKSETDTARNDEVIVLLQRIDRAVRTGALR